MDDEKIKQIARNEFNRQFNAAVIMVVCGFLGWQLFAYLEWIGYYGAVLGILTGQSVATKILGED